MPKQQEVEDDELLNEELTDDELDEEDEDGEEEEGGLQEVGDEPIDAPEEEEDEIEFTTEIDGKEITETFKLSEVADIIRRSKEPVKGDNFVRDMMPIVQALKDDPTFDPYGLTAQVVKRAIERKYSMNDVIKSLYNDIISKEKKQAPPEFDNESDRIKWEAKQEMSQELEVQKSEVSALRQQLDGLINSSQNEKELHNIETNNAALVNKYLEKHAPGLPAEIANKRVGDAFAKLYGRRGKDGKVELNPYFYMNDDQAEALVKKAMENVKVNNKQPSAADMTRKVPLRISPGSNSGVQLRQGKQTNSSKPLKGQERVEFFKPKINN